MTENTSETVLIVDDEEPVRRTFREWLAGAGLDCTILTAHDAESALSLANEHTIDLAILDWALGAGDDGLQLLQDLSAFHPEVTAILVTGYRQPGHAAGCHAHGRARLSRQESRPDAGRRFSRRCASSSITSARPGGPAGCIKPCWRFAKPSKRSCRWCNRPPR